VAIKELDFYVCPLPDCPDYFGSVNMPPLERKMNRGMGANGDVIGRSFPRADCPTCRVQGRQTTRLRVRVVVDVPEKASESAEVIRLDWQGPHVPLGVEPEPDQAA
jgi:hypothetical protein